MVMGPKAPKGSKKDSKGRTVVPKKFQGPTRPSTDVSKFRRTGISTRRGGSGGPQLGPTKKDLDAEIKRQAAERKSRDDAERKSRDDAQRKESARRQRVQAGQISGQISSGQGPQLGPTRADFEARPQRVSPGFRIGLSDRERGMSTSDIVKGRFGEVGRGVASAGIIIAEGGINLLSLAGTQKLESAESLRQKKERGEEVIGPGGFRFGGTLGEIRDSPTGTGKVLGQVLVAAPLVVATVATTAATVATQGFRFGVKQVASSFAPFTIRSGTFGALETASLGKGLKFDSLSFKQTSGDVTTRVVTGKARGFDDVTLLSKQVSRRVGSQDIGGAVTDITAPFTKFNLGQFTQGVRTTRSESIIGGLGGGKARVVKKVDGKGELINEFVGDLSGNKFIKELTSVDIKGFTSSQVLPVRGGASRVTTRTRASIGLDELGTVDLNLGSTGFQTSKTIGALTKKGDQFDIFTAGPGRRIVRVDKEGISRKVRVDDFNLRGVEFDIGKLGQADSFSINVPRGKSPKGGSGLELSSQQISSSISSITPITTKSNGKSATSFIPITSIKESLFAGTGQFETTSGGLLPPGSRSSSLSQIGGIGQDNILKTRNGDQLNFGIGLGQISGVTPRPGSRSGSRSGSRTRTAVKTIQNVAQIPRLDVAQEIIPRIKQREEFVPALKTPQRFSDDPFSPGLGVGGFFGFPSPKSNIPSALFPTFTSGRKRAKGRKARESISPSLTGIVSFDLGGITGGPLQTSGASGRSPFDIRFVPKDLLGGNNLSAFGLTQQRKTKKTRRKK